MKTRKTISFVLSLIILLSSFCQAGAVSNQSGTVTRDTVLLLDVSGSMRNTPISVMKAAAIKFCSSVLSATGTNRVAIVPFESSASVNAFTDDITTLQTKINSLSANGGTNIYSAMQKADDLLKTSDATTKNIVLLTDGLPQSGTTQSDGKYTSSDSSYYRYANAVYSLCETYKNNYNIYTLGFFHSLSGSDLTFARTFLSDIQNKGYYDVTNVDNLEFTFGEIAEEITNDNCPIIIIPGIMGSNLYFSNTEYTYKTKAWSPGGNVLETMYGLVGLGDIMKNWNLYTRPYENQNDNSVTREYGARDTYRALVDGICEQFGNGNKNAANYREVYFFSYDFRQSNVYSADALEQFINSKGFEKVDIVAHSMGGLVASNYMLSEANRNHVRKLITCGTPYEGAPKLLNCVLNWDVLTNKYEQSGWSGFKSMMSDGFLGLSGLTKDVKASFTSTAELCPTKNYFKYAYKWYQYSYTERSGFMGLKKTHYYDPINFSTYQSICTNIFGSKYNYAADVQESLNVNDYNILTTLDNTYFVIGINQMTIGSIWFNDGNSLNSMECDDLAYECIGDGTVPYYSASVMKKLDTLPNSRVKRIETDHVGTCSTDKALKWIYGILKTGASDIPDDSEKAKSFIVVRIACPVEVKITKNGSTLSSDINDLSLLSEFGRLDMLGGNDEIKMLCLDDVDDLTLNLVGTDEGTMDYEIRWFDEKGEMVDSKTFSSVPVKEGTLITTTTNETKAILDIDENGDGVSDYTILDDTKNPSQDEVETDFGKEIYEIIMKIIKMLLEAIYNYFKNSTNTTNVPFSLDDLINISEKLGNIVYHSATK